MKITHSDKCISCEEEDPEECDKSRRPECNHHCNHTWSHDICCWCEKEYLPEIME